MTWPLWLSSPESFLLGALMGTVVAFVAFTHLLDAPGPISRRHRHIPKPPPWPTRTPRS